MPWVSKYPVDERQLRALHREGLTNRRIAEAMDLPHWRIGRELPKLGLKPNGRTRGQRVIVGDQQQCSGCGKWAHVDAYPFCKTGNNAYRLTHCYACKRERANRRRNSGPKAYLTDRCAAMRSRAKKIGVECDVTADHLIALHDQQAGRCFYTDVPLVIAVGEGQRDRNAISIDRVDNRYGYVKGNVVLVSTRTNTMKSDATLEEMATWMPEWHRRAIAHLAEEVA